MPKAKKEPKSKDFETKDDLRLRIQTLMEYIDRQSNLISKMQTELDDARENSAHQNERDLRIARLIAQDKKAEALQVLLAE